MLGFQSSRVLGSVAREKKAPKPNQRSVEDRAGRETVMRTKRLQDCSLFEVKERDELDPGFFSTYLWESCNVTFLGNRVKC